MLVLCRSRQGARHWEYARDDQVYGGPRAEVLDDDYHKHLAMLIRGSRPKVDMTDHIRLSGDGTGATDMMSQLGGAGGKPRLVKHDDKPDRKRVVEGKRVSVSVDLGGRRNLEK